MRRISASGFTLIEVLIATGILVTVAAGAAQLFGIAVHHEIAARQQVVMIAAAEAKLDELAGAIATSAAPSAAGALDHAIPGYSDLVTISGVTMERRWVVTPLTAYAATAVAIAIRVVPSARASAADVELMTIAESAS